MVGGGDVGVVVGVGVGKEVPVGLGIAVPDSPAGIAEREAVTWGVEVGMGVDAEVDDGVGDAGVTVGIGVGGAICAITTTRSRSARASPYCLSWI